MNAPKVTIAIPTFNRADYLRKSIEAALKQNYSNIEVIVTDNQSSDHTPEVQKEFQDPRVKWLRNEKNLGMFGNWNRALDQATGEYFLLLSDDDLISENFVTETLRIHQKTPDVAFVYGHNIYMDHHGNETYHGHKAPEAETGWEAVQGFLASNRTINPCGVLFRTWDLRKLGGYPERYRLAGDAWVWMTLALQGKKVGFAEKACAYYRIHPTNETSQVKIDLWLEDHHRLLTELLPLTSRTAELTRSFQIHDAILVLELLNKQHQQGQRGALQETWKRRKVIFKHPNLYILRKTLQLMVPPEWITRIKTLRRKHP